MIRFRDHLAEMLKDKEFAQGYEKELHAARLAIEIARARENLGMTQADLATKAHITQQQLSKVENAKACNVETLFKVCDALEMDLTLSPRKAKFWTTKKRVKPGNASFSNKKAIRKSSARRDIHAKNS